MFDVRTRFAEMGLYLTPRKARGMSAIIIKALNITALSMALSGDASFMMFRKLRGDTPDDVT
jgi:hypothetical protein